MMLSCISKGCKNKSYAPRKFVEKNKIGKIICQSCAMKVQEDYLKLSTRKKKRIEVEVDKTLTGHKQ